MGLIFHSNILPYKSGPWGLLLPQAGALWQEKIAPNADNLVLKINPSYIEFVQVNDSSNRGLGLFVFGGGAITLALMTIPMFLAFSNAVDKIGIFYAVIVALIPIAIIIFVLVLAIHAARALLAPPVILSRKLRKFYQWQGKKKGWVVIEYDTAVAHASFGLVATTGGGYTFFKLHVTNLDTNTREIMSSITVSDPVKGSHTVCEWWEFIRQYMSSTHAELPAIAFRPSGELPSAFHARLDRDFFIGIVDKDHHLAPGAFNRMYFWWSAMVEYWMNWLMVWIEKTAPRPAYPVELAEVMQWHGENAYKVTPPSSTEQAAIEGKLPHLNHRWRTAKYASTFLWISVLVGLTYIAWSVH